MKRSKLIRNIKFEVFFEFLTKCLHVYKKYTQFDEKLIQKHEKYIQENIDKIIELAKNKNVHIENYSNLIDFIEKAFVALKIEVNFKSEEMKSFIEKDIFNEFFEISIEQKGVFEPISFAICTILILLQKQQIQVKLMSTNYSKENTNGENNKDENNSDLKTSILPLPNQNNDKHQNLIDQNIDQKSTNKHCLLENVDSCELEEKSENIERKSSENMNNLEKNDKEIKKSIKLESSSNFCDLNEIKNDAHENIHNSQIEEKIEENSLKINFENKKEKRPQKSIESESDRLNYSRQSQKSSESNDISDQNRSNSVTNHIDLKYSPILKNETIYQSEKKFEKSEKAKIQNNHFENISSNQTQKKHSIEQNSDKKNEYLKNIEKSQNPIPFEIKEVAFVSEINKTSDLSNADQISTKQMRKSKLCVAQDNRGQLNLPSSSQEKTITSESVSMIKSNIFPAHPISSINMEQTDLQFSQTEIRSTDDYFEITEKEKTQIMSNLKKLFENYCKLQTRLLLIPIANTEYEESPTYLGFREFIFFCNDFFITIDQIKSKNLESLKILYKLMTTLSGLTFNKFIKILKHIAKTLYEIQNPSELSETISDDNSPPNNFSIIMQGPNSTVHNFYQDNQNRQDSSPGYQHLAKKEKFLKERDQYLFFYYAKKLKFDDKNFCENTKRKEVSKNRANSRKTDKKETTVRTIQRKNEPSDDNLIIDYLPRKKKARRENRLEKDENDKNQTIFEKLYNDANFGHLKKEILENEIKPKGKQRLQSSIEKSKGHVGAKPQTYAEKDFQKKQLHFLQHINWEIISKMSYSELTNQMMEQMGTEKPEILMKELKNRMPVDLTVKNKEVLKEDMKENKNYGKKPKLAEIKIKGRKEEMSMEKKIAFLNYGKVNKM